MMSSPVPTLKLEGVFKMSSPHIKMVLLQSTCSTSCLGVLLITHLSLSVYNKPAMDMLEWMGYIGSSFEVLTLGHGNRREVVSITTLCNF